MRLDPNMGATGELDLKTSLSQKAISYRAAYGQDGQLVILSVGGSPRPDFAVYAANVQLFDAETGNHLWAERLALDGSGAGGSPPSGKCRYRPDGVDGPHQMRLQSG
jgi:hypothetical protein